MKSYVEGNIVKFQRIEKYGPLQVTPRKMKLIASKPERDQKRQAEKMPLFAELLTRPAAADVQAELLKRQQHADAAEKRIRTLHARVWRESRRDYFSADVDSRADIRKAWTEWTGPRTSTYFRYIVDLKTGVMDERSRHHQMREVKIREMQKADRDAQTQLFRVPHL